ncbi:uncharacterized protein LOC125538754 isoform X3 [Triticum urartu]|uniref:uncharacterized protein LOC125538754 isoform X3 n=2 Tax=Triticum urartu TaxID=4572 RepID=UPI0020434C9B|nr:uncharacterized protein LOC125538754 isoform X3 [Triticum urartu]
MMHDSTVQQKVVQVKIQRNMWNKRHGIKRKGKTKQYNDADDGYRYGHLYTYGMFPLSMPSFNPVNDAEVFNGFGTAYIWDVSSVNGSMLSFNPVNDAEVFNGFGMQSHPNVENRSLGCNEGVVYEEALQHISQETKEEDMSQGFNRWSSAAKGRERQSHHWKFTV